MFFFFQAEDGIRDLVRSRGLGDVYKRQGQGSIGGGRVLSDAPQLAAQPGDAVHVGQNSADVARNESKVLHGQQVVVDGGACLLYTSPSPRDRTRSRMPSSA